MTTNEDRTIAFHDSDRGGQDGGLVGRAELPRARMICLDTSQLEGSLPGDGVIKLVAGAEQIVGRGSGSTFQIPSRKLSRQHARVFAGLDAWGVEDLNSTNGIQVNRNKVTTAWLNNGDEVRFGPIPFRFEVDQTDISGAGRAALSGSGEDERTMMVGSLGAGEAIIKAQKAPVEAPPEPVATVAPEVAEGPSRSGGGRIAAMVVVVVLLAVAVGGAVVYYPTWQKDQEIAAVVGRADQVTSDIIAHGRALGSQAIDPARRDQDITNLNAVNAALWPMLRDNPDRVALANTYAKSRTLLFERVFTVLIDDGRLADAADEARSLYRSLTEVARALPDQVADRDKVELATAIDIADLASIMVQYRRFATRFGTVARSADDRSVPRPDAEAMRRVEARKDDFFALRRSLNKALASDYRQLNGLVGAFEANDLNLVARWRDVLRGN